MNHFRLFRRFLCWGGWFLSRILRSIFLRILGLLLVFLVFIMVKKGGTCSMDSCPCGALMAVVIIVLVWVWPAVTWSKVVITIAAALILLGSGSSMCKTKKKK